MRDIDIIAREIRREWHKPSYSAKPYIEAMLHLSTIDDRYYFDSARTVILYFLSNARTWRGDVARRVKKELKDMCDESDQRVAEHRTAAALARKRASKNA